MIIPIATNILTTFHFILMASAHNNGNGNGNGNDNSWCNEQYLFALDPQFINKFLKTPPGIQENKFNFSGGMYAYGGHNISYGSYGGSGGSYGGSGQSQSPTFSCSWGAFDPSIGIHHPK